jgi:hypothetical protein
MPSLIGNKPNQVPTNGDLGTAAFMDAEQFWSSAHNVTFRNQLINGDFRIAQRATSGTIAASSTDFVGDRWVVENSTNQTLSWSIASSQSYGRNREENYLALSFTVAPTSGTVLLRQRIEDVRNLAGGNATLAFDLIDAAGIVGTTITTQFEQVFGSGGSSTVYSNQVTHTAANGRISSTIPVPSVAGKTIGTSSFVTAFMYFIPRTASYWVVGAIQAEAGSVATPFERRPYGTELSLCQRYFQRNVFVENDYPFSSGYAYANSAMAGYLPLSVAMRAQPTATIVGNMSLRGGGLGGQALSSLGSIYYSAGASVVMCNPTTSATNLTTSVIYLIVNAAANSGFTLSAEL